MSATKAALLRLHEEAKKLSAAAQETHQLPDDLVGVHLMHIRLDASRLVGRVKQAIEDLQHHEEIQAIRAGRSHHASR